MEKKTTDLLLIGSLSLLLLIMFLLINNQPISGDILTILLPFTIFMGIFVLVVYVFEKNPLITNVMVMAFVFIETIIQNILSIKNLLTNESSPPIIGEIIDIGVAWLITLGIFFILSEILTKMQERKEHALIEEEGFIPEIPKNQLISQINKQLDKKIVQTAEDIKHVIRHYSTDQKKIIIKTKMLVEINLGTGQKDSYLLALANKNKFYKIHELKPESEKIKWEAKEWLLEVEKQFVDIKKEENQNLAKFILFTLIYEREMKPLIEL